jgi:DNA primase
MKVLTQFIRQLNNRIKTSEIVGEQVRLIRKGKEFSGLCPFHNEKTPSFTVNDEKGFYHCFGCGAHGDIVKFLTDLRGYSFNEALKYLADKSGLALPSFSKEEKKNVQELKDLGEIMELATDWFQAQLFDKKNDAAREYLIGRSLNKNIIEKFRLGYAPNNSKALKDYLLKKGATEDLLSKCGLIITDIRESFDRFRERIMFPIFDEKGKVIAFGGRTLGNRQPKYLNSPETILFRKSEVLFGENFARETAYKENNVIVVEGYIDVIALHNHNITTAVAALGTAITQDHLKKLWRLAKEPIICMDGDAAGERAAKRVAELAIPLITPGHSLKFTLLPAGKDPDTLVNESGRDYIMRLFDSSLTLSEMIWQNETAETPLKTPEQKAELAKRLFEKVSLISDRILKTNYLSLFKSKMWEEFKYSSKDKKNSLAINKHILEVAHLAHDKTQDLYRYENSLVALIIENPYLLYNDKIKEEFILIEFNYKNLDKLRSSLLEITTLIHYIDNTDLLRQELKQQLQKKGFSKEVEYLCGSNSTFIDKLVKTDAEKVEIIWSVTMIKYHIALLNMEYKKALSDEETIDKAVELRAQILKLEGELNEYQDNSDACF